jgi:ribosome-interacting GTPase 1
MEALEEMIKECPKHKAGESMRANLRTRYKKLKEKTENIRKSRPGAVKKGIKKEDMQAAIIGVTNSGKSSLLKVLTNVNPKIGSNKFTTKYPLIGMMDYKDVQIQIIENPAFGSGYYERGITNSADTLIILITDISQLKEIEEAVKNSSDKKIIVFNKTDLMTESEKRKIFANLQSRKYNFILISCETGEGIEELKAKIFQSFDRIRVYTKEPGKPRTEKPIILSKDAKIRDVAEKIFHGLSTQIKEVHVTGPSSKFPNQKVSLTHTLKDLDVVEFKMK